MTITINGTTGIAGVDGSAATPAVQGGDTNTGVFYGTDIVAISTGGTERMRVDSSGNVGIGTTSPDGNLEVSGTTVAQYITRYSTDTSAPAAYFRKSRGTADSRTIIESGDNIGQINFQGYDGSSFSNAAQILVDSDGTPGVGDMPGRMLFRLSPDGSSSVATRIAILSTGYVGISNTAPVCILDVTGGIQTSRTTVTSPAATDGNIFSGTYTPTLTNTTNVAASTASAAQYMRVGNVVTVSGQVAIDPTTAATNTTLNMSLPIASAITSSRQLGGSGSSLSTTKFGDNNIAILGDATNDRAELRFNPTGSVNETYNFTFTYQVL